MRRHLEGRSSDEVECGRVGVALGQRLVGVGEARRDEGRALLEGTWRGRGSKEVGERREVRREVRREGSGEVRS